MLRSLGFVLAFFVSALAAPCLAATITTVAGGGTATHASGSGVMAVDAAGTVYIPGNERIVILAGSGAVSTIALPAGTPRISCLAVDSAGNVYYGHDYAPQPVRKVTPQAVVTTFDATLVICKSLAFDAAGNLYIGSSLTRQIHRRDAAAGTTAVVAGNGQFDAMTLGGPATGTNIGIPLGIAPDSAGGFYFTQGTMILHVNAAGLLSRVTGSNASQPTPPPASPGSIGSNSGFTIDGGFSVDSAGNIYIASFMSNRVFRVDSSDVVHPFAGTGNPAGPIYLFGGDGGPAAAAWLAAPRSVLRDAAGNAYIADSMNQRIRKVDAAGTITSLRQRTFTDDAGPATGVQLGTKLGVGTDATGAILVADTFGGRVRRVDPAGMITTVAGQPDGVDNNAIKGPAGLALDGTGRLHISSLLPLCPICSWHSVSRIEADGSVVRLVGGAGFRGDGAAAADAQVASPWSIAFDAPGNLYIADTGNKRVRKVDTAGVIRTIAGDGLEGFGGDGGPAIQARISAKGIAVDASGNIVIADTGHHRIRRIDTSGVITTIAGGGSSGLGDGGPALSAKLAFPEGIAIDPAGKIFIADTLNHRIRMVALDGTITTLAGTGVAGFAGDGGAAENAQLNAPTSLAFDASGSLLVGDSENRRVRRITLEDLSPDAFAFAPQAGVPLATPVTSAAATPTGYTAATSVAVTGGEYSIGCTATFVATAGTINPGESICVRHTSSAIHNKAVVTTLDVGGRTAVFTSTTLAGPGSIGPSPSPLAFELQSINTTAPAQTVTVTNTGAVDVTIHEVLASVGFGATHACALLAPAATCSVVVTFTPVSEGAVNGSLTVRATSGDLVVALSGSGERALVSHYYRSILGRAPEAGGRAFWEGEAARFAGLGANPNEVAYAMAAQFFGSAEYTSLDRDNTGFVTDLYRTFFNRAPDAQGLAYWRDQIPTGVPREVVMVWFMFSPEFVAFSQAIFGTPTSRPEVDMVMDFYRGLLSRLPDSSGFNSWLARFRTAQCSGAAAVRAEVDAITAEFIASPEYQARNRTNGQYVGDLYNAILRRGGDPSSVRAWIMLLDNNTYTRGQVRGGFLQSSEFQQRVNRVSAAGCLP